METLSNQEEEAMTAIWLKGEGFIREFLAHHKEPKLPYTTLSSTIKNLERKKYIKGLRVGNCFRYKAMISEIDYKKQSLNIIVNNYFKNSYKDLVTFFATENKINSNELEEIIKLIEKR